MLDEIMKKIHEIQSVSNEDLTVLMPKKVMDEICKSAGIKDTELSEMCGCKVIPLFINSDCVYIIPSEKDRPLRVKFE